MARAGVDRATWVRVHYPLAKPMHMKRRIQETQPIEEEEIPEDILNRYRENQLDLPALTVPHKPAVDLLRGNVKSLIDVEKGSKLCVKWLPRCNDLWKPSLMGSKGYIALLRILSL